VRGESRDLRREVLHARLTLGVDAVPDVEEIEQRRKLSGTRPRDLLVVRVAVEQVEAASNIEIPLRLVPRESTRSSLTDDSRS
jgi:hypothetical protein